MKAGEKFNATKTSNDGTNTLKEITINIMDYFLDGILVLLKPVNNKFTKADITINNGNVFYVLALSDIKRRNDMLLISQPIELARILGKKLENFLLTIYTNEQQAGYKSRFKMDFGTLIANAISSIEERANTLKIARSVEMFVNELKAYLKVLEGYP
ncbi:hypothetical protein COEREDRAFT_87432 [Coemansia reversa NRRL 1564]|uniref:Uncharacterized protein n=1 Tax=Coemansia reversa (strain ATCC 12441 / NRRL 1564) TaxID=763665 RepID=A0A2G5BB43_COERN|nr:hypothetical protein COEREDRAFT_87432 [Coemansia reversa NRRL 1564]|eukprot:PIA15937.1 hypothetical protein COEREDRAFT_87432 [Coemansia reversa NRRL 1564]